MTSEGTSEPTLEPKPDRAIIFGKLAKIANLMVLTPAQAIVLPACVNVIAKKMGLTEANVLTILMATDREELRRYVASVCASVAEKELKELKELKD